MTPRRLDTVTTLGALADPALLETTYRAVLGSYPGILPSEAFDLDGPGSPLIVTLADVVYTTLGLMYAPTGDAAGPDGAVCRVVLRDEYGARTDVDVVTYRQLVAAALADRAVTARTLLGDTPE